MLDLQDRFINFLMSMFYDSLKADVKGYGLRLAKALEEDNAQDRKLYLKMITETQGIIDDLGDENMDIKDFVGLLAEKYGFVRA